MNKYLSLLISLYFMPFPIVLGTDTTPNNAEEKSKMIKLFSSVVKKNSKNKKTSAQKSNKKADLAEIKFFLNSIKKLNVNMKAIEYGDYVSGCELVSIVNLLNHYGYNTNLDEFYKNFFEQKDWYIIDNVIYAPDPNLIYPGDPKIEKGDNCGFGCFGKAVEKSINNFFDSIKNSKSNFYNKYDIKHKVVFEANANKDRIRELLNKKTPVIIWSTQAGKKSENGLYDMRKSGGPGDSWIITSPEESKGKSYTWLRGEHCSVIYDHDESSYSVCDPFRKNIKIKKDSLDKSRELFGNQIVYLTT